MCLVDIVCYLFPYYCSRSGQLNQDGPMKRKGGVTYFPCSDYMQVLISLSIPRPPSHHFPPLWKTQEVHNFRIKNVRRWWSHYIFPRIHQSPKTHRNIEISIFFRRLTLFWQYVGNVKYKNFVILFANILNGLIC